MKKLIIIVIIGAGAWYGVQWFLARAKDTAGGVHGNVNKGEDALKKMDGQDVKLK